MDKDMRVMSRDAVLEVGDIVRIITLEEAERRYMTVGDDINFPEQGPYTLDIAKNNLNRFGGMMARIRKVNKVCGHFHYGIQIVESGENVPDWWCPSAFTVCEDDEEETAELAPPDPESMWYFLGVTDSVSLRGKI